MPPRPRTSLACALLLGGAAAANAQDAAPAGDPPSDPSLLALDPAALDRFASEFPTEQATPNGPPVAQTAGEEERWSSFLPLMKDEALARGYQLPLPFGVGMTCTVLSGRDIHVRDLSVSVNGAPNQSVSHIVDIGSESNVFNTNLKFDTWILPFLNVYALAGYVYNESDTKVHVTVPKPPALGGNFVFDLNVDTRLDGFVGGGGLTLAGGYGDFFIVVDSNYTVTDIGFDDNFRAIVASIRTGFQGKVGTIAAQFWVGGSYWDTNNVAKGHQDIPGVGRVHFEADQGPVYPWVVDFGTNLRFSRSFEAFADVAFDGHGGVIATVGPVFRF